MLKAIKIIGLNSDTDVALPHIFQKQSTDDSPDIKLFFIAITRGTDAFIKTRQLLPQIEDGFYLNPTQSITERLTEAAALIQDFFKELEGFQFLLAATTQEVSQERVFYVLNFSQDIKTILIREGKETNLGSKEGGGQLLSGFLEQGDRIVMITEDLLSVLAEKMLSAISLPLDNIEDEITALLPQGEIFPVAGIVLEEEKKEQVEVSRPVLEKQERWSPKAPPMQLGVSSGMLRNLFKSKKVIGGGILLLLIVLGGLFFFKQRHFVGATSVLTANHLPEAKAAFDKSLAEKDSNSLASITDFQQARKILSDVLKTDPQNSDALNLKKEMDNNSFAILKIAEIADFPLWLDLDLVKKGFAGKNMSLSHGKILLLDINQLVLVAVGVSSKAPEILAGQDKMGEAKNASLNGDLAWIYSASKGVVNIDTGNRTAVNIVKKDAGWGGIIDLYGFAGNVYLLDELKNQIWKYVPIASGYSDKSPYLKEEIKADFLGAKRLQIDSSVWVLKRDGEIQKFTQGSPDNFSFANLDKPVGNIANMFVSEETDNVYLLDPDNKRLLVVDKKGVYKAQYVSDRFTEFSDLIVSEADKKIYLLAGSKILQIDLK